MSSPQKTTDNKSTDKATKARRTPEPSSATAAPAAPVADLQMQNADPGTMQRSLSLPQGNGQRRAMRLQRAVGNHAAQQMIARAVQKNGGKGKRVSRVSSDNGSNGQPMAIQRSTDDPYGGMEVSPALETAISSKQGGGSPLDDGTRNSMEGSFGQDFSDVRVHNDSESDTLNRSVGAQAFTVGNDVFFSKDSYKPGTSEGDHLIAHELTHTVQQGGGHVGAQAKMEVGEADDKYEQEADATADAVVSRQPSQANSANNTGGAASPGPTIQRADDEEPTEEEKAAELEKGQAEADKSKEETKGDEEGKKEEKEEGPQAPEQEAAPEAEGGDDGGGEGGGMQAPEQSLEPVDPAEVDRGEPEMPGLDQYEWEATKAEIPDWDSESAEADMWNDVEGGDFSQVLVEEDGKLWALLSKADVVSYQTAEEMPLDRDQMIADAWKNGALTGLIDGAIAAGIGVAIGLAAKKIPVIGGLVAMAQILIDPEAWFKSTVMGGIIDPGKAMFDAGKELFNAKSVWQGLAAITTLIMNIYKMVAGIANLISTILSIIAAVLWIVGQILMVLPFGVGIAPGTVALSWAGTLTAWAANVGVVGAYATLYQIALSLMAAVFRTLDLKFTDANPEELMAKQAALQSNVKDFTSGAVSTMGNAAFGAVDAKMQGKSAKQGAFDAVFPQFQTVPKPGKTPDVDPDANIKVADVDEPDVKIDTDDDGDMGLRNLFGDDDDVNIKVGDDDDGDMGLKALFGDEDTDVSVPKGGEEDDGDMGLKNLFDEGEPDVAPPKGEDVDDDGDLGLKDLFDEGEANVKAAEDDPNAKVEDEDDEDMGLRNLFGEDEETTTPPTQDEEEAPVQGPMTLDEARNEGRSAFGKSAGDVVTPAETTKGWFDQEASESKEEGGLHVWGGTPKGKPGIVSGGSMADMIYSGGESTGATNYDNMGQYIKSEDASADANLAAFKDKYDSGGEALKESGALEVNREEKEAQFKELAQTRAAELPERPETEAEIMAIHVEMVAIEYERQRLQDIAMDAQLIQEVGTAQATAGRQVQAISSSSQGAIDTHVGDLQDKLAKQADAQATVEKDAAPKMAENEKQASKGSGMVSGVKGEMEGGMEKAQEEGGGAGADPNQTDKASEGPSTASDTSSGGSQGAQTNAVWQKQSTAAVAESGQIKGVLQNIDSQVEGKVTESEQGVDEAATAQEQSLGSIEELNARQQELVGQRDEKVAEANTWVEEHRSMRQAIIAELEAYLNGEESAEEEEPEAEAETTPAPA